MSTVHKRLKSVEAHLEGMGGRLYSAKAVNGMDDAQAEANLRAETDRLALLIKLETELASVPNRRNGRKRKKRET